MCSRLCDVLVYVEPQIVIAAMVYAVVFAVTTCGLAICAYIHVFGGLRPATILLAGLLAWYTLSTAYWVAPLADAVHAYFRALAVAGAGRTSLSSSGSSLDDTLQSGPAPVLMCATPGYLAISILVGEAIVWWRVCALWAGNRAVRGTCALSLFVTAVLVGVTMGRLEFMKSPPTRLAVIFFVEPDGVGTCASVLVSNVVQAVLLGAEIRKLRRKHARLAKGSGTLHGRLRGLALGAAVAATFSGASWVVIAASRRQMWTAFRDDNPTRALWTFALFVATASCMRVPALVWWLPQSFVFAPVVAADGEGRAPPGGDSRDDRTTVDGGRIGGVSYSGQLGYQETLL